MKTDRLATFGAHDKVLAGVVKRKHVRLQAEMVRKEKSLVELSLIKSPLGTTESDCTDSNSEGEDERDGEYVDPSPARRKHRRTRTGSDAFIPSDILKRPKLVSLATRMKITPAQQAAFTQAVVEETAVDTF